MAKNWCRFNNAHVRNFDAVYDVRFEHYALFGGISYLWRVSLLLVKVGELKDRCPFSRTLVLLVNVNKIQHFVLI